jgi:hypothetical protein
LKPVQNNDATNEELLQEIERVWVSLGRQPTTSDFEKKGIFKYSLYMYKNRFGGWRKALEAFIAYVNANDSEDNNSAESINPQEKVQFQPAPLANSHENIMEQHLPLPSSGGNKAEKPQDPQLGVFGYEKNLEDAIIYNLEEGTALFGLPLKIWQTEKQYGRQYCMGKAGRADILAVNTENGDWYVIELKKGRGDDEIVGQVSRYMGWVIENLAEDGQNVCGFICTKEASPKLELAAKANPQIRLFNYGLQMTPV